MNRQKPIVWLLIVADSSHLGTLLISQQVALKDI
jgi:hypothetical protein